MANKPVNILTLAQMLQGQDSYAGQFGDIKAGLEVRQPPASALNPFCFFSNT